MKRIQLIFLYNFLLTNPLESSEIKHEKGIRGRVAVGKENVAILEESTVLEDVESGKK